jgi:Uma2 family endonuclease
VSHSRHGELAFAVLAILAPLTKARSLKVTTGFNLGEKDNYRVPDGGLHRAGPGALYNPTAALVLEVLSPGDETWDKLPFYADHGADEIIVVDPDARAVTWLGLADRRYEAIASSDLLDLGAAALAEQLDWPE